jgi:hypothetical protein
MAWEVAESVGLRAYGLPAGQSSPIQVRRL